MTLANRVFRLVGVPGKRLSVHDACGPHVCVYMYVYMYVCMYVGTYARMHACAW
jgi:hypothetical protein